MSFSDAALLLLGHGSTLNADSSAPTYQHAEEIRKRGVCAEVQVAFWKEEPNFRQALALIESPRIFVVPNFISSGYFTEQVIPRELGLTGPVTEKESKLIYYTEPVGLHPSMTEALLLRAQQVVAESGSELPHPEKTTCLFICGHGTSFNDNSTKIIYEQAAKIRALGRYADCQAVLMEQSPFVKDWRTLTTCRDVVVVPFFIADGLHSYEDIPVLLGLTRNIKEQGFTNPHQEGERRLWYASAIGTEAYMAEVILAQMEKSASEHAAVKISDRELKRTTRPFPFTHLPAKLGQVVILQGFFLQHEEDENKTPNELKKINSLAELRDLIRTDASGNFRPLRAAPNLRSGWTYGPLSQAELILALDYLYPGAWGKSDASTPWQETAERQTGRFKVVRDLSENDLLSLVKENCETGCLKQRLWAPANQAKQPRTGEIQLLCPEACNYLVGKAREKIKGTAED